MKPAFVGLIWESTKVDLVISIAANSFDGIFAMAAGGRNPRPGRRVTFLVPARHFLDVRTHSR